MVSLRRWWLRDDMPLPPFAGLVRTITGGMFSLQPSASTIDNAWLCLSRSTMTASMFARLRRKICRWATLRACAAHAVSCSRRCSDDVQVGLYVTIGHKKDVSFHVSYLEPPDLYAASALANFCANLALAMMPSILTASAGCSPTTAPYENPAKLSACPQGILGHSNGETKIAQ